MIATMLMQYEGPEVKAMAGLTLNNLSCSYKRDGQVEEAQRCLKRALELQEQSASHELQRGSAAQFERSPNQAHSGKFEESPRIQNEFALTELNLCAIYAQKGNHQKAKMFAHSAIHKLRQQIEALRESIADCPRTSKEALQEMYDEAKERQSLLAIAHYNLGCQQEHLKEYEKSMDSYLKAVNIEKVNQGSQPSPLLAEFVKSYKDMKSKVSGQTYSKPSLGNGQSKASFTGLSKRTIERMRGASSARK